MSWKNQPVVFEVLSGLFGWVWIGGRIAALVFAGLAFFNGWSWWYMLYAAIVSIVAKWLARGFVDNKKRVAFEADMVSKGMSPKQAGQAWLEAYAGNGPLSVANGELSDSPKIESNRRNAKERAKIIADYGAVIERNPSADQIWDVKCLPHDKNTILDAICLEIVREDDERRVEILKGAALFLADYQEGVGDKPISILGLDFTDPALLKLDSKALGAKILGNPHWERFATYKPIMDRDISKIQAKLRAAEQLRREMPEEKKREILT